MKRISPTQYLENKFPNPTVDVNMTYEVNKIHDALDFLEVRVMSDRSKLNPLEYLAVDIIVRMAGYNSYEDAMQTYIRALILDFIGEDEE